MWVIYDHPSDAPKKFVVRVWYGLVPEMESTHHDTLEDARESIWTRGGCMGFARDHNDDPTIIESWL